MRLVPALTWTLEERSSGPVQPLDPRFLPLLAAIAASGSLAAAVAKCGMSYRSAWGLLREYGRRLDTPVVLLERGRGARLAPAGRRLLDAQSSAERRLARVLPRLAVEIPGAPPAKGAMAAPGLRVAASHDIALAALAGMPAAETGLDLGVSFMGSLHALAEFAAGRADVAGFHVPIGGRHATDRAPFLRGLRKRRDRLIRFVDREQGLILARGNPRNIGSLRDIAARGLRFINRQRGSASRLLVDQMLVAEGIDPSRLDGYAREEFTHPAVAATVASGGADAGFGLRAAAAEYGLAFVPLVRERYFLAVRARDLETPGIARLIDVLRGAPFARIARRLPGYRATAAGTVVTLEALATAPRAP